mgnify:FL=1|tara:strand:+ start:967 stop:1191 length:225 start_codon:yes stop_codon:yes gene_type:complete
MNKNKEQIKNEEITEDVNVDVVFREPRDPTMIELEPITLEAAYELYWIVKEDVQTAPDDSKLWELYRNLRRELF